MSDAKKNNRKRAEQAFDHEVRVLQIVDMASMTATEAFDTKHLDGALEDFVDHLLDVGPWKHDSTAELSEIMQRGSDEPIDEDFEPEPEHYVRMENASSAARAGYLGLGIQFGSPVRKYTERDSYYSGFGYMRTTWIYADTFEEAWQLGLQWAIDKHAEDQAQLGAA
ncbi:hypothetical protein [Stutzerimonas nitrititolerans]